MGRIAARKRKDGSVGYTARVQIKKAGKVIFSHAQTFDRESAAKTWITKKEKEFASGSLSQVRKTLSVAQAIDKYIEESRHDIGRTKTQVLRSIKDYEIADMNCADLRSQDIVAFAAELGKGNRQPQTVLNYISHLGAVFANARVAWGVALPREIMLEALDGCQRLGLVV